MSQAPPENGDRRVDLDERLQEEIESALGDMSAFDLLEMAERPAAQGSERQIRTGTVREVRGGEVMVEFGPKSMGICPASHFKDPPQVGEQMAFVVERHDADQGFFVLSRQGAVQKAQWESMEVGQVVEGVCVGVVKGGLEVMVANHKGFLPASQVDTHFVKDISLLLNERVRCQITELNRRRGRLILSRRKVLEVEREEQRRDLMGHLEPGLRLKAKITSIQDYGAFADIGGADGLIHISDMSYERIKHPSEVVKEGDVVEVQVLRIDLEQKPPRISLGLKQCLTDPFQARMSEIEVGQTVSGRVTRIRPFGAFVELAPGVEGLIHISQLSHDRVSKVNNVVKPGEVVNCQVLSIDQESRRISLSMKALTERPTRSHGPSRGPAEEDSGPPREEDPVLRKLKAQLSRKFGDQLKGGLG